MAPCPVFERRSPTTEQQYEASFLDDPLPTFSESCLFTCKAGWEGVFDAVCNLCVT